MCRPPRSNLAVARRAALLGAVAAAAAAPANAADDVFIYSSASTIRGLNLTLGTDSPLTTSPIASAANALAINAQAGFVYYGDDTSVYRWDPALGNGAASHSLMANFAAGPVTAPITALDSTAGSYLDGVYYVGSENAQGYVEDLYALTMSFDGSQVVAAEALDLLGACGCTPQDLGGFGDVAAVDEAGLTVLYGSTSPLGTGGGSAGRWRFVPSTDTFTFLATAQNGQMSNSLSNRLYSNVGQGIREVDRTTGLTSGTTLFTTSASIFDFTSGFSFDFGDAPDSYGGAFHGVDAATGRPRIGTLGADNDPGTLNASAGGSDGAGDDAAGVDDEDALSGAAPVSVASGAHSISVQCSAGTRVAGWIDFDRDGRFDPNERNDNHPASCAAGQVTLEWVSLGGAQGGDSWLRLRASSNLASIAEPVGIASDGEVEDHPIAITGPSYGSCPAGSVATTYTANDLPLTVPASAVTVASTITVPAGAAVTDVNVVGLDGTHTWISDLRFFLAHDGTERRLYGYSCDFQDDFAFSFDDEAGTVPTACPPTTGQNHLPAESLDAFDGTASGGTWELRVQNRNTRGRVGAVQDWGLEICTAAPVAEAPALRLGKAASVSGRDATITLALENIGNAALADVALVDDLDAAFGVGNHTVIEAPTLVSGPSTVAPESGYTGAGAATGLLAAGSALAPGERVTVRFAVRIDTPSGGPGGTVGAYENSATGSGTSPGGTSVTDVSNAGLDLTVDADAPTPVVFDASARLSGRVFVDVSGVAISHDGVLDAGEPGVGGRTVSFAAADGTALGAALTDGQGAWRFDVPAARADAPVTVRVNAAATTAFVSEAPAWADADLADGRLVLVPGVGAERTGLDVGVAPAPRLESDRVLSVAAGARASFAHAHVAGSHGTLSAAIGRADGGRAGGGGDELPGATLLADANCDGTGDAAWAPPITVVPGQRTCFVVQAFLPAAVPAGTRYAVAIDTTLVLSDTADTGHATSFARRNVDTVTVAGSGEGRLQLSKRVRNVTLGEGFGNANAGLPGHVLEYEIEYRNSGTAPLDGLRLDDLAPPYTTVQPGTAVCADVPSPLACSVVETGASLGWRFTGSLPAGSRGSVTYRVAID